MASPGINPTVTPSTSEGAGTTCGEAVLAPDGSPITVPHTVNSFGDRIATSPCPPHGSSGTASSHDTDAHPLKVIARVHAVAHPPSATSTSPASGDFVERGNGSIDGAATIARDRATAQRVVQTFADPTTPQHHWLESVAPDPVTRVQGLTALGQDTIRAAPSTLSSAAGAIRASWDALGDYATATSDPASHPEAVRRTFDRARSAVGGLYDATLGPAVNDAVALGTTLGSAAGSPTAAQDLTVGAVGTVVEVGTLVAPEAKAGAEAVRIGSATAGEAERTATETAGHLAKPEVNAGANVATTARKTRVDRNSDLPTELRTRSERATENGESADPWVAKVLPRNERRSHHLIPVSVIKDDDYRELFQDAAKAGFRTDEASNIILLPKDTAAQAKLRLANPDEPLRPVHNSGHPNEITTLAEPLDKIKTTLRKENLATGSDAYNRRASELLRQLENKTRTRLLGQERVTFVQLPTAGAAS